MKNLNDLTVIIVTYRTSEKIIYDCLNSIDTKVKYLNTLSLFGPNTLVKMNCTRRRNKSN